MKISAAIMAHPDRTSLVTELQAGLDRPVPVYWDPGGPPSPDPDRSWRVAREVWSMADPDAGYHMLIQDDAVPCRDLLAGLELALDALPEPGCPVSPYLGSGYNVSQKWDLLTRRADHRGAAWIRSETLLWGVCLLVPTSVIPEMVDWCDRQRGLADDIRVGGWCKRQGLDAWYTWPSLVDHRTGPSLTKPARRRHLDRTAHRHHHGSALEVGWHGPVVVDPTLARRRPMRSGPRSGGRTGSAV